ISNTSTSDETGITVTGIDGSNNGYVLADESGKYSPDGWATIAVNLAEKWKADCIVAEKNQGGDMVQSVIRAKNNKVRIKLVTATKGKYVRAEPIYSLYEQGKVFHVGYLPKLEAQMCIFTSDLKNSPDRVDSLVWGLTELMLNKQNWFVV